MPKVRALTPEKRFEAKINNIPYECECLMLKNHITKTQVAELVGTSRQAISSQFKRGTITLETFVAVMNLVDASGEKMERLVSIK